MDQLALLRAAAGPRNTNGLEDSWIQKFLQRDTRLAMAINKAVEHWRAVPQELYQMDEQACIQSLQRKFQSLYPDATRQPYVPLAAQGPWIVTLHGAVVHDSGGYGMLTFGHSPPEILRALATDVVQANIMTASLEHGKLTAALEKEIGRHRGGCPYESFVMLNSGSEGNSFITRLVDINTGHNHNGRAVKGLVVKDSFHGRTFRAALLTDTTQSAYEENKAYLLSNVIRDYKITVEQNNLDALRAVFAEAEKNNWFIETMYLEGIQGEGNPGSPLSPSFYALARELTLKHGSLLVIDNIQAGLRCTGDLSIVDFPGFATLPPPDFEVWAKAINAGQYPTSLIALAPRAAEWYRHGVYGNTMTGNPRACAVASAVLGNITPELRKNIVDCGKYAVEQYTTLMREMPNAIVKVLGTGLLYSVKLNAAHLTVVASDGVEMSLRRAGVNVIHGGENALRFTPNLNVTREEIDMQVAHVRQILLQAEALLGELRPLESRNVSIQTAVGEHGPSALCTFKLDGHLFDSGALTKILDLVEEEHARALVHNIQVGRNMGETSVATVQLFADDQSKVKRLLSLVSVKSSEHDVRLSLLSDAYEAMAASTSKL